MFQLNKDGFSYKARRKSRDNLWPLRNSKGQTFAEAKVEREKNKERN